MMSRQQSQSRREKKLPQYALPRGFAGKITYLLMSFGHKAIYENVARLLDLAPDDDLVEVACGNGHFLKKYASQVRSLTGLDLSRVGIELARRKHAERVANGTAEFVCSDASKLPWGDGVFSVAAAMGSLPGLPEPLKTLKEMHRVLRPGGRAVLSIEWNAEDGKDHSRQAEKSGYRIWTEREVRSMLEEAGFSAVDITYAKSAGMPKMMLVKASK
jgi:SAM-dependent methyltransferase